MKEYFLTIITATFFLAILDGVLPQNNNGKLVKTIITVVSVSIILVPILNFFKNDFEYNYSEQVFDKYDDYLLKYQEETTINEIKTLLNNNKYDVSSVEILNDSDKQIIKIILLDNGINEDSEHINSIENAQNLVKERLYLNAWEVQVEYSN